VGGLSLDRREILELNGVYRIVQNQALDQKSKVKEQKEKVGASYSFY